MVVGSRIMIKESEGGPFIMSIKPARVTTTLVLHTLPVLRTATQIKPEVGQGLDDQSDCDRLNQEVGEGLSKVGGGMWGHTGVCKSGREEVVVVGEL